MKQRGLRRVACVVSLGMLVALLGLVGPAADGSSLFDDRAGQADVVGTQSVADRATVCSAHLVSPGPSDYVASAPASSSLRRAVSGHLEGSEPVGAAGESDPSTRGSRAPPAFVS